MSPKRALRRDGKICRTPDFAETREAGMHGTASRIRDGTAVGERFREAEISRAIRTLALVWSEMASCGIVTV